MNVTQLREMLQELEAQGKGEMEVQTSYNYGDYWRTQVAQCVDSVEEATVVYSEYHSMDKVVEFDEQEDEDYGVVPEGARAVIILG
jgi:hypothetical protein